MERGSVFYEFHNSWPFNGKGRKGGKQGRKQQDTLELPELSVHPGLFIHLPGISENESTSR